MSSATSAVRDVLLGYLAGRVRAEHLAEVVARAYYRDAGRESQDGLRPLLDIIERVAPGRAELTRTPGSPGFEIRTAQRAFPPDCEGELREAVEAVLRASGLGAGGSGPVPGGFLSRLRTALRRLPGARRTLGSEPLSQQHREQRE
jgi:hypothetical protein